MNTYSIRKNLHTTMWTAHEEWGLCDTILVEVKCVCDGRNTTYFQIVEEINYMLV
jgi:hypothetical protein